MSMRPSRLLAFLTAAAAAAALGPTTTIRAHAIFEVIASGLDNPRGLAFGPDGALYVAEAGRGGDGPCITNSEGSNVCYGATGAITRVSPRGDHVRRVVRHLPSLARPAGAAGAGTGAIGPVDVGFSGHGGWAVIGLGADPAKRAELGDPGMRFARLLRFTLGGAAWYADDLGAHESAVNPDGGLVDTNPYGLLVLSSRTVFADAGANALNEVSGGVISTLAVFPTRLVPFGPPGNQIPMQGVPTSVVRGPDGALYVAQLTGFPFPVGGANVYRVPSTGGSPEVYADGFTNIIDIAFGADGSLYVLEIAAGGLLSGNPTGRLVRVAPDGSRTTLAGLPLVQPGGLAIRHDGALYVTRFATLPGGGDVVRITP